MYNLVENIQKVKNFVITQRSLNYRLQDKTIIFEGKIISKEYEYYNYIGNTFIQYGKKGKHCLLEIKSNKEVALPQILLHHGFNGKIGYYIANYVYDNVLERSRSDLYKFEILAGVSTKILSNSADILVIAIETNLFLWLPKTTLKSLSLLTGDYEWELDLGEFGEIEKILGVYNNQLLVWLSGDKLINIQISNGTINYTLEPFIGLKDMHNFPIKDFRNLHLVEDTGKILMLYKYFYYEICLNTQKVVQLKSFYTGNAYGASSLLNNDNLPTDIDIRMSVYTDNYIYFLGGYTFGLTTVGVFDRQKNNIVWLYNIVDKTKDSFLLKEIQVSDDKLYVLDTEGTLHIFEKESHA